MDFATIVNVVGPLALVVAGVVVMFVRRKNPVLGDRLEGILADVQAFVGKLPLDPVSKTAFLQGLLKELFAAMHPEFVEPVAPTPTPAAPPALDMKSLYQLLSRLPQVQSPPAPSQVPTPVSVAKPA